MWELAGALLTIADCFRPALGALARLGSRGLVWADCEALSAGTISVAARSSCLMWCRNRRRRATS